MTRKSKTNITALVALLAASACAATIAKPVSSPTEKLDALGVSKPALLIESGTALQFFNADAHPHQIYSNDCQELSSRVLRPGEAYTAPVGFGPRLCHFQDLLAPLASEYWGTVNVKEVQTAPDGALGGG